MSGDARLPVIKVTSRHRVGFVTVVCGLFASGCHRAGVVKTMGADVEVRLVDSRLLGDVRKAVTAFVMNGDVSSVRPLVVAASSPESSVAQEPGHAQVMRYLSEASLDLLDGKIPTEVLNERTGETLMDRHQIVQYRTERSINRLLVLFTCAEPLEGGRTVITLSRGDLAEYMRSRSKWLDEMLSMSNELLWDAEPLRPSIGADAWLLTMEESGRVLTAIKSVKPPTEPSALLAQYMALERLFEIAAQTADRRVLVTVL